MNSILYKTDFRDNSDLFPECLIPIIKKEIWIFPDTSVLVKLSKILNDNKVRIDQLHESEKQFLIMLSTQNLNVMHMSVIEGSRKSKMIENTELNQSLAKKLALAYLKAQCIDVRSFDKSEVILSNERVELMLSEYPYKSKSLSELAEQIVVSLLDEQCFYLLKRAKDIEESMIRPLFELTRYSYINGKNSYEKVKIFKDEIDKNFQKYTPKLFDFCIQSMLYSERKDSLLKGVINKFKHEIDHFAIDIAFTEVAVMANNLNVKNSLKAWNILYSYDKSQHYYSKIGFQFDINLSKNWNDIDRIYSPDFLIYQDQNKKTKELIYSIFKVNNPTQITDQINHSTGFNISQSFVKNLKIFKTNLPIYDNYYIK